MKNIQETCGLRTSLVEVNANDLKSADPILVDTFAYPNIVKMPKRSLSLSGSTPKKKKIVDQQDADALDSVNTSSESMEIERHNNSSTENLMGKKLQNDFFELFETQCSNGTNIMEDGPLGEKIKTIWSTTGEEEPGENKATVDQCLRDYLLGVIIRENRYFWYRFLEMSIKLAREELCNPSILFTLISDLMELSSLQECQQIFDFVETHLDIWKDPLFLNSGKNAVLRMCNDLLRRLSRAQNTIFCGRILIFLSNYFPFSERSALNIMSEFNNDNITEYKLSDGQDDTDDKMDVSEEKQDGMFEGIDLNIPGLDKIIVATQEEKRNKTKVDYNLYVKFWSLQEFFRSPTKVYEKIVWKTFTLYINDVLSVFHFFKMDCASKTSKLNSMKKRKSHEQQVSMLKNAVMNDIPKLTDESLYFAKYLTNRRLLELQMNDPSFRRYFLVQLLIILQYLTATVKFKNDGHTLNEEQQEFVRKTQDKVHGLLEETPPHGKQFVKAVKHVLSREILWNQWKNDSCPAFKKPTFTASIATDAARLEDKTDLDDEKVISKSSKSTKLSEDSGRKTKRRRLGDIISEATKTNRFLMGNSELTRLWNICGNNLDACSSEARDFTPPIDVFFAEAFKELDQETTSVDAKKSGPKKILGNSNFGWRALRLLARKSPYFFQMFGGSPVNPLQNYLEFVLKKILAERDIPLQPLTPDRSEKTHGLKEENMENSNPTKKRDEDQDAEVEGEVEDDEEMMQDVRQDSEDDEEEGEVKQNPNPQLRNLTDVEMKSIGESLGVDWKKLAGKLGFKLDEINYFEEASDADNVCVYMLQRWNDQEGDEATVADLVYILEGLGFKDIASKIFP